MNKCKIKYQSEYLANMSDLLSPFPSTVHHSITVTAAVWCRVYKSTSPSLLGSHNLTWESPPAHVSSMCPVGSHFKPVMVDCK